MFVKNTKQKNMSNDHFDHLRKFHVILIIAGKELGMGSRFSYKPKNSRMRSG